MLGQQSLVLVARILATAVEVDDQSGHWSPRLDLHAQGIANQGSWHARRHCPAHDYAGEQVDHDSQVEPACAGTDVRDIRGISLIRRCRAELSGKDVQRNRQSVLAVGRVYEFALPDWLQAGLLHQAAHLVTPDLQIAVGQCRDEPAAPVTLADAHKRGTQMRARFAKHRRSCVTLGFVKSSLANAKKTTSLCDRYGLRLQIIDEPIANLSSRAKKADALLRRPHHYEVDGFPAPTDGFPAAKPITVCQFLAGLVARPRTVPSNDGLLRLLRSTC